jgi:tetratricopeptide (TPR) repeat protein
VAPRPRWREERPSANRPRVTPEQRLEAFRKIVERSPDDPFARYSLAMGHRGAGQLDHAVRAFEELARRVPGYVPTYLMWGQTLEMQGQGDEAARVYDRGIQAARQAGNDHALSELTQAREALPAAEG